MGSQRAKRQREKNRRSQAGNAYAAAMRRAETRKQKAAAVGCELWQSCPRARRDACTPPAEACVLRASVLEAEAKVKVW